MRVIDIIEIEPWNSKDSANGRRMHLIFFWTNRTRLSSRRSSKLRSVRIDLYVLVPFSIALRVSEPMSKAQKRKRRKAAVHEKKADLVDVDELCRPKNERDGRRVRALFRQTHTAIGEQTLGVPVVVL